MFQKQLIFLLSSLVVLASCNKLKQQEKEKPVARVYDTYIYASDIINSIPDAISAEDSLRIARRVIDGIIKEKLLLKRAEQYLSGDQIDVEKQVAEYRSSLINFKYKQKLLAQNLDTVISEEELQSYYDLNASNYILDNDVVKVTYVKVPFDSPQISDVRRWFKSEQPEDLDNLEKYCLTYASNYMIKGEKWFRFVDLIVSVPLKVEDPAKFLNSTKNIEVTDSSYFYFIHILDRIPEGQISPLDLVRNDIRNVILNKRKISFIDDLENSIYNDGRAKNNIEIY